MAFAASRRISSSTLVALKQVRKTSSSVASLVSSRQFRPIFPINVNELNSQSDKGALHVRSGLNFAKSALVWATFLWTWVTRREQLLHLDGDGFGECEAQGGLGGQDNLLVRGVGRSRGSRTSTQCCADEGRGAFAFALLDAGD
jgi:hypothetical protein